MLFSSFEFLFVFLPICTLALVLARPLGRRTSLAGIVDASLYFYGWFYPPYLLLLSLSIGVNYLAGQRLRRRRNPPLLFVAVAFNVLPGPAAATVGAAPARAGGCGCGCGCRGRNR